MCPDKEKLSLYFGIYGFYNLLTSDHIEKIKNEFDVFAPILVESQQPGYGLNRDIQKLFRKHANNNQRENMVKTLRKWLTSYKLERSFGWRIVYPREAVHNSRILASEMLVEWGDIDALPLIRALKDSVKNNSHHIWLVERAENRLQDPCSKTFLYRDSEDSIFNCKKLEHVTDVEVRDARFKKDESSFPLAYKALEEFWELLSHCWLIENTQWNGGWHTVRLEFYDGVIATFCPQPSKSGIIVYKDNTSIQRGRIITLQNIKLHSWLRSIIDEKLEE
jgi:hypothetical protein